MNNISYKKIIEEKGSIIINPVGTSMLPLIRQDIDTVLLSKITTPLKKYDVVLFDRPDGKHVLHRIVKVRKNSFDICGDNQVRVEHGVTRDMIIARMEGVYREEAFLPVTDPKYIEYSIKRVRSRKWRFIKWLFPAIFRKIFKKKKRAN